MLYIPDPIQKILKPLLNIPLVFNAHPEFH